MGMVEARRAMLPIVAMYEREAKAHLKGRGRETYQRLADALRLLIERSPL